MAAYITGIIKSSILWIQCAYHKLNALNIEYDLQEQNDLTGNNIWGGFAKPLLFDDYMTLFRQIIQHS